MKRSIYAVISLMMAMVVGFTACGDDDKGFSAEQIAYFEKNLEFIREKKVLKGDDGGAALQAGRFRRRHRLVSCFG